MTTPAKLAERAAERINAQERLARGYVRYLAPPPRDSDRASTIVVIAVVAAIVFVCSFPFFAH